MTGVNDNAPVFTSPATANVEENRTAAYTAVATDADGDVLSYSLSGTDAALFTINETTGEVSFNEAPDAENPDDANGDNVYNIVVTASDNTGGTPDTNQAVAITVTGVNDNAPVFNSPATANVEENRTAAYTAVATDADGDPLTYSLSGTDAGLFTINETTGEVSFNEAPDVENPDDANGDNVYDIVVTASDNTGGTSDTNQAVAITVTGVNDNAPVFTSPATASVEENQTVAYTALATDADGDPLTYSLSGTDAGLFTINETTGEVSFNEAPDVENPDDANGDNVYDIVVTASDNTGGTPDTNQAVAITVTDVNDNAPVFTSLTTASAAENQTSAYTAMAADADAGDVVSYRLSGGADVALFTIDETTGVVSFMSAPDFDNAGDADTNNVYEITVTASDGTLETPHDVAITVTDVLEVGNAPTFTSPGSASVEENQTMAYTTMATDADGDALTYSLSGTDAALFTIDPATGVVSFIASPDFEDPGDVGGNNVYDITVTATDGTNDTNHPVAITVTNVNDNAPVFTSPATANVEENQTAAYTAVATDADGDVLSYSLSGTDAALFTINETTGEVSFNEAPDAENPDDANGDNVYDIIVTASDNTGGTPDTNQAVAITVTGVNDNAPVFTSPATASVAESETLAYTAVVTDADGDPLTYSLSGTDAARFTIDPATGEVNFNEAPDVENPDDANGDNVYNIIVTASDNTGGTPDTNQAVAITVTGVNDNAPVFTSPATASLEENQTAAYTAVATDADGDSLRYSLSGTDAALFTINATTGVVSFINAPDFESPGSATDDNDYEIIVTASDGTSDTEQAVTITVTDVNEGGANAPPVFTSPASVSVAENQTEAYTAVATDADGDSLRYSLSGTDAALFTINETTGEVSFNEAPDAEDPDDANGDNVYDIIVTASDGTIANDIDQAVAITVTGVNDNAPVFTSPATANVEENQTAAYTALATDADGDPLTYSLSGTDAARFTINPATGVVSFNEAPDVEAPSDANGDNVYEIVVTASDNTGGTPDTNQAVAITVTNVNDNAPVFTSPDSASVAENQTSAYTAMAADADAGDVVSYRLSGGADVALFTIDETTGVVSFMSAPDFENAGDADTNNVYEITVTASDGTRETPHDVAITVTDETEVGNAPTFSSPGSASVEENQTMAYTAMATDADGDALTYSLSGTDAALFTIDPATGVVSFIAAPDFEDPGDVGGDNVYDIVVTATDGPNRTNQPVAITVTNVNDNAPVFTSPATANVEENQTAAYTALATDADGDSLRYSLSGMDAALFTINETTGEVSFNEAPDAENPDDANGDNVYDIIVTASDNTGGTTDTNQAVAITVTGVNDNAPVFISPATANVEENQTAAYTAVATDADGDVLSYSLSGTDAGLFTINAATGEVSFNEAPDVEDPDDANGDNVYDIIVTASDGTIANDIDQAVAITVTGVNDNAPVFTSPATASLEENQTAAYTAVATDADGDPLTYSLSGTDAARFTINETTGVVSFIAPPDFENAGDAGGDNVYDITVTASDGDNSTDQNVAITVTDVDDSTSAAPVFTSPDTADVAENQTEAYTAMATDADGDALIYSLSGTDAALFTIDAATGEVSFREAPDAENPGDNDDDNVYDIVVTASDGTNDTNQAVAITVTDVNDNAPVFTSPVTASVAESETLAYTAVATDGDGDPLTYSLSGTDAARFTINETTGEVSFNEAPDVEDPDDANGDNVYNIVVTASDNTGGTPDTNQAVAITVTGVNNNAPVFASPATANVEENQTAAYTAVATDGDGDVLSYSLSGTDAGLFTINAATGEVSFNEAPDAEDPDDANGDNVYNIVVTASDNTGGTPDTNQAVAITVTGVNDNSPVFTSPATASVAESETLAYTAVATDADGDSLRYSLSGTDAALFTINETTGEVSFNEAPDVEDPDDANGDNVYNITVTASDNTGGTPDTNQAVAITVTGVNDNAPVFTSPATASVEESQTLAYTAVATDADGDSLRYSLSGTDAALFTINETTGEVSFNEAPDVEDPDDANGDNVYNIVVTASDGTTANDINQAVAITVTGVNDNAPVFTSPATANVEENQTAAYTAVATDADGDPLTYSLSGTDAGLFTIDPATGVVSFSEAPDVEDPDDANGDNVYDIVVTASDNTGGTPDTNQAVAITVTDVNDNAPVFTSPATAGAAENQRSAYTAVATDADGDTLTYGLSGTDAELFTIDGSTGVVSFRAAPDFEMPGDDNGDNDYSIIVTAFDGDNTANHAVVITVTDENEDGSAPVFTSPATAGAAENQTLAYTAMATDGDGDTVSYRLSGADAARFTIDETTGVVSFMEAPDFENPADAGGDNVYNIIVTATDDTNDTTQAVAITVTNVNDNAPVFTSPATASVAESETLAYTAVATDADGDSLRYSLSGTDAGLFTIDPATGVVSFNEAPDAENPDDANGDNVYDIVVTASDNTSGTPDTNQAVAITVTNVNDNAPVFTSPATANVEENQTAAYTAVATDADGDPLTYSLSGTDAALFTINETTGEVSFNEAPDVEDPDDANRDNVYDIIVTASDNTGGTSDTNQAVAITVTNVNDNAPAFTSPATATVEENQTAAYTAVATDADGDSLRYSLSGTDAALFTINETTGEVSFNEAPDIENPDDANGDNVYNIVVTASDNTGGTSDTNQAVAITVTGVNDNAPVFTSPATANVEENQTAAYTAVATDGDGDVLSYSLSGTDAGLFTINAATGEVSFNEAPDVEDPDDANGDNVYNIVVTASDNTGGTSDTNQAVAITVTGVNDNSPVFTSPATVNVEENQTAAYTALATDADGDPLTYSLSGTDAGLFTIDPATGEVSFNEAPDAENPDDANGDNVYDIIVTASDNTGGTSDTEQAVTITVTDVDESGTNAAPVFTSPASVSVAENQTEAYTAAATDADGDSLTFSLSGADSDLFTINPTTGVVSFNNAPDFESPGSATDDNDYNIIVTASDGTSDTEQAVTITVTDVDESGTNAAPVFSSPASVSVAENQTSAYTAVATDADNDPLTYSLSGTDAALFTIDSNTGVVSFIEAPDFENPNDAGRNNVYNIIVTASDNTGGTPDTNQAVAITVTGVNDNAPVFTSPATANVEENQTAAYTAMATDADGDPLTYSLSGTDAGRFTINAATGVVSFNEAPDVEAPSDANGDNVYNIIVTASDNTGGTTDTNQAVAITVTNVNDNDPVFTSPATASVAENQTAAYTAVATDADEDPLTYSLSGADAELFAINGNTGVVSFKAAPDFEMPGDDGGDNDYNITVTASDGDNTTNHNVVITVTDEDEIGNAPVFTSPSTASVAENQTAAYTAVATDADNDPLTYSLSGTDAALFMIDSNTGVVSFIVAPDFENPDDAGGDNVYDITVRASDNTNQTDQDVAITVTDEYEPVDLGRLDGANGFTLNGIDRQDYSGFSVSSAGDVNGDGYDDLIIGAWRGDPNGNDSGESYVVYGGASAAGALDLSTLDGSNGFILNGVSGSDQSGRSVSSAGDVNGDGYDDLIIGGHRAQSGGSSRAGEAYVVYGGASAPGTGGMLNLSALDGSNGFTLNGSDFSDYAGRSVSSAGDVNGDGYDDLVIGAYRADPNGQNSGETYVVYGGPGAPGTDGVLALSDLDGANGFTLNGVDRRDESGFSVSSAGDVNGDGYDDLIIGADVADPNGESSGEAYVVYGGATGTERVRELSDLDGTNGFILNGIDANDQSGRSVSSAGDVNGDGYDDLIIGAFNADPNGDNSGETYVVYGGAGAPGINGVLELSALDGTNGFTLAGIDTTDRSGVSVSSAGDVNGDGYDDLIIGASSADPNGNNSGETYVVYGGARAPGTAGVLELSTLNGTDGFVLIGAGANDRSGTSVSSAGDVNGDGYDDLIIGADGGDPVNSAAGESYVVYGGATGTESTTPITAQGTAAADNFTGNGGADSFTGIAAGDVVRGGAGDDSISVTALDFADIDGGTGQDTLLLAGANLSLDLRGAGNGGVDSVEVFDLSGSGADRLVLDALAVFDLTEERDGGMATLDVLGDANDTVRLAQSADQAFALTGQETEDGVTYNVYRDDNAEVRVETGVRIQIQGATAPVFTSPATAGVAESQSLAYTAVATDADEDPLTYSLSGTDAALFTIDATTGAVSFITPPDFENAGDAGGDNVYNITVTASDDTNQTPHDVTITVTNENDNAPIFNSPATASVAENQMAAYTALATDADGDTLSYSLSGTDAGRFTINAATGVVRFSAAPDFENPDDAGGDNVYNIIVTASDNTGGTTDTDQAVAITVTGVNDNAPVFTSLTTASVAENQTLAYTALVTDGDGDTLTYSLSGTDAALFTIDPATGVVSFRTPPDFEMPGSEDGDNVYDITVTASDGDNSAEQAVAITVTDENEVGSVPVFTSPDSASVEENQTMAYTAMATDADGDSLTYSLSGTDAALFTINETTGVVSFIEAPDFEEPGDAGGNNVYNITVTASDGDNSTPRDVAITVTGVNDNAPVFSSLATASVAENQSATTVVYRAVATDADGDALSYSLSGTDAALFTIDANTGDVRFREAPDAENPGDDDNDNVYDIIVTASDNTAGTTDTNQAVAITVTGVNDNAPVFNSPATASVAENQSVATVVYRAVATDADGDALSYSLSGTDAARFTIDANTGDVRFREAPDAENPGDDDDDNVYDIIVTASDSTSGTIDTNQAVAITVTGVNDNAPVFTSPATANVEENQTAAYTAVVTDGDGDPLTYSLSGTDAALFTINETTGEVSFNDAPDAENPDDANGDNVYDIVVTASDNTGGTPDTNQAVAITVTDVNDNAPVFNSPATASVEENQTAAYTALATDADGDPLTYSLSGTDAGRFTINAATGVVSFSEAPDFENPDDANGDNVYDIIVTASDSTSGTIDTNQAVAITVTGVNDNAPVFTSPDSASVAENQTAAYTAMAADADAGDMVSYRLSGGADVALFTIDEMTGVVSFMSAPDFENAGDVGTNNVYEITVTASDGTRETSHDVAITVTDETEVGNAPTFSSPGSAGVEENQTMAYTAVATDADEDPLIYSLSGTDAALFTINPTTGAVSFIDAPDFEDPDDAGGNNVYDITVTASDGTNDTTQPVAITVTNINDNTPSFTSPGSADVEENQTLAYTAMATDGDGDTLTYSLSGTDAVRFTIDPTTGAVSFIAPPDFENPDDAGGDNVYDITVTASDDTNQADQDVTITVTNENDNDPIFTSDASVSVAENQTAVYTAIAADADGDDLTYSLSGTDAARFTIDPNSGAVSFIASPDFEDPDDAGGDNVYDITVTASDDTNETDHDVTITVTNENDNTPSFTSDATAEVAENSTAAYTAVATDADGDDLTYSLSGTDAALFTIDPNTGAVSFIAPPDFENPGDDGDDNVYDIIVTASDGDNEAEQPVAIRVTDEYDLVDLGALDGTNGFILNGIDADDFSGVSVSSAGDVNGDGYDDLIIGAYGADPGSDSRAGEAYVIYGGASAPGTGGVLDLGALDGTNGFILNGIDADDFSGWSVSSAGDVNGDGYDDLTIGARGAAPGGETYVVYGGASAPGTGGVLDLGALDGTNGFTLNGINANDRSGTSVSSAGDVNGDGYDDLIIGARYADPNGDGNAGETYIVYGGANAPGTGGVLGLSMLDGTNGFTLTGIDAFDFSGRSVSSAGDVNGDGYDDLIIGADAADPNGDNTAGETYIVYGGANAPGTGGVLDLSALDGTNGFILNGFDAYDRAGFSVSSAGDVNGDGYDDLIIGAYRADPNGSNSGETYVVYGGASAPGTGGVLDLSTLDGANGFILNGIDGNDRSGISVSSAGDINGDGYDDLIIGASRADPNGDSDAGETYIVYGGASAPGTGGVLDLSGLDGTNGFTLNGIDSGDRSGRSVSSAGDVNGDGYDDLIIGARGADPFSAGETYVIYGGATGTESLVPVTAQGTAAADNFTGNAGDDSFTAIATDDVVRGGAGDDTISVTALDFAAIDGGTGADRLVLAGAGLALDLTGSGNAGVDSVEVFDLSGTGANSLVLDAQAVFDLTEERTGGIATLDVLGNTDDTVDLSDSNFTFHSTETENSTTYTVYRDGNAEVRVQTGVQIQLPVTAPPVFTSDATARVAENQTAAYEAQATDEDSDTLSYSLSGTDAALFTIDPTTGVVSFITAPDFENPGDVGGDNVYDITVTATDGSNQTDQDVTITVTNENDNDPIFNSPATAEAAENQTEAYTAIAADADGDTLSYSLSGTDAALFTIDPTTGAVRFIASPDFENPGDTGGNNVYDITVTASDDDNSTNHDVAITVTNVNDNTPSFTSDATVNVAENQAVAYTAVAADGDGDTLTYGLSGIDAARFMIDPATGVVSFIASPDFENPADAGGNNVYDIVVTASDGPNDANQPVAITVTNVNDNTPAFSSPATVSVAENQTAAYTAVATDADGDPLSYSLSGTDAARFTIDPATGVVRFSEAPDFEMPGDVGEDNVYNVIVTASDGTAANDIDQAVAIRVTDENEVGNTPVFSSPATASVVENQRLAYTALATDADGDLLSYGLSGTDAALFTIDPATGAVRFIVAPDFENPGDDDDDNVYDITVTASDGMNSTERAVAITVTNENDNTPSFTSGTTADVAENQSADSVLYTAQATDEDGDALTYSLSGTDAARFTIDPATGAVRFVAAPDFENPGDDDDDNVYDIIVTASDNTNETDHIVAITVTNENDNAPTFTSGTTADVAENQSADSVLYTAQATDEDGDALTYSLSGTDAARFTIDPATGAVRFIAAPDFENPGDDDDDNVYDITVTASDNTNETDHVVAITVTNENDNAPTFTSGTTADVAENQSADSVLYTAQATDEDGDALTYSLSGTDAARFTIDPATGAVRFIAAPDFENPGDDDDDNVYDITVTASDNTNETDHVVAITVTNENDNAPTFTSGTTADVAENQSADSVLYTAQATDEDGDALTYSLSGTDAARFTIDPATGAVRFIAAPDFENPGDDDDDNVYDITVTASDNTNETDHVVAITVTNENDNAPTFTSGTTADVAENQSADSVLYTAQATDEDGDALTYSLSGTDAARFTIDPTTGAVRFIAAPDFENPGDDDDDNVYDIIVTASDNTNETDHAVAITVTNENDNAPTFTSGTTADVAENQSADSVLYTAQATDEDGDALTYSLSGTDAARFTIDPTTGAVRFIAAPDFENPGDDDDDNVYDITVTASDNTNETDHIVAITVTNENDNAPTFTSGTTADVAENQSADSVLYTAQATDEDGDPLTYSLSGTDAARFTIDPATGAVRFIAAPDFENPGDDDDDNVYDITVTASDNTNETDHIVAITVTNENDNAPTFTSGTTADVAENQSADSVLYTADGRGRRPADLQPVRDRCGPVHDRPGHGRGPLYSGARFRESG